MNTLKSRILNPAQTSIYSVIINPPIKPTTSENKTSLAEYFKGEFGQTFDTTLMELTCVEASLPGSSLATIETMDYMGVTEKHAYRRLYDDTVDFTFLTTQDSNYQQIRFFDSWMRYITREENRFLAEDNFYSRVRYPKDYQGSIKISKFEKNLGSGFNGAVPILIYNFVGAYPKSVNSIPVTYDASDLLKVTVSFTYTRYYIDKQLIVTDNAAGSTDTNSNSPGVPENNSTVTNSNNSRASWRYSAQELDRIRGAAAAASLAGSPLGQRILEGNTRSSTANQIAIDTYGRLTQ